MTVIDTSTNSVLTEVFTPFCSIAFDQSLGAIAVNPAGTLAYVPAGLSGCSPTGSAVHRFDTATNTFVGWTGASNLTGGNGLFIGPMCPGACTDGNICTTDTCNLVGGCTYANNTLPCAADGNECTDEVCDGAGNCSHPNLPPGATCDDGTFCNGGDTCDGAGGCTTHAGDPCAGGPECADTCDETLDTCDEEEGASCTDDGNPCTDEECDGAGNCVHPAGNAGLECRAQDGTCDSAESCDGLSPTCPPDAFEPDGTTCDDAAECTIDDQCTAGTCGGNSMTCGDGTVQSGCNEDCDDGGFALDDGCDDACRFEPCKPEPDAACKEPFVSGKASIKLKNDLSGDAKDSVLWKWNNGTQTDKPEPFTKDDGVILSDRAD